MRETMKQGEGKSFFGRSAPLPASSRGLRCLTLHGAAMRTLLSAAAIPGTDLACVDPRLSKTKEAFGVLLNRGTSPLSSSVSAVQCYTLTWWCFLPLPFDVPHPHRFILRIVLPLLCDAPALTWPDCPQASGSRRITNTARTLSTQALSTGVPRGELRLRLAMRTVRCDGCTRVRRLRVDPASTQTQRTAHDIQHITHYAHAHCNASALGATTSRRNRNHPCTVRACL